MCCKGALAAAAAAAAAAAVAAAAARTWALLSHHGHVHDRRGASCGDRVVTLSCWDHTFTVCTAGHVRFNTHLPSLAVGSRPCTRRPLRLTAAAAPAVHSVACLLRIRGRQREPSAASSKVVSPEHFSLEVVVQPLHRLHGRQGATPRQHEAGWRTRRVSPVWRCALPQPGTATPTPQKADS